VPEFALRAATPGDAAFLYEVYETTLRAAIEAAGSAWPRAQMRLKSEREAADARTRIVQLDGRDCGLYRVEPRADEVWLDMLFLLPGYQHRGLGSRLLAGAQAQAETRGVPLRLQVVRGTPAIGFYRRHGFTATGETPYLVVMTWRGRPGESACD
jgi:GNAT superfamily N-acetyltransferase